MKMEPASKGRAKPHSEPAPASDGLAPLDVMLEAIAEAYRTGGAMAAFAYAKETAPYVHAKLASATPAGAKAVVVGVTKEEVKQAIAELLANV